MIYYRVQNRIADIRPKAFALPGSSFAPLLFSIRLQ
jgi:hypothetical protein